MASVEDAAVWSLARFAEQIEALEAELIDPLLCRTPAYGAPGYAHCAACCYGTGVIVTCEHDEAVVEAAKMLGKAAVLLRQHARAQLTGEGA